MKNEAIDAEWTPSQRAAAEYSRKVRRQRRQRDRQLTVWVQRLFVAAWLLLVVSMAVALALK